MMIESFIFLASAMATPPAAAVPVGQVPAVSSAILEMTYDAFVAVEESPGLAELAKPAIFIQAGKQRAILSVSGKMPIS